MKITPILLTALLAGAIGAQEARPPKPAQPPAPAKPAQPAQPAQPAKPAKPAQPGKRVQAMAAMRLTGVAPQREKSQSELQTLFDGKIAEPWVKNADWILDYHAARAQAAESGKRIFAYFTRSYAP
jgi:hypothetical protein